MEENDTDLSTLGNTARTERKNMRIELVRRLMLRGVKSPTEIKQSLESMNPPVYVTIRSIMRYKSVITKRMVVAVREKEGLNKTIEEMAMELKNTFEEITREMWRQYHAPIVLRVRCPHGEHKGLLACNLKAEVYLNAAMVKVAALKEIRETAAKQLDVMQSLGLVNKAPVKIQSVDKDGNPVDPVAANTAVLNQQFNAFINATYKDPVGVNKGTDTPEKQEEETDV